MLNNGLLAGTRPREIVLPLTSFDQVCQQLTPLCPELVGARQTAVPSDHAQVCDAQLD